MLSKIWGLQSVSQLASTAFAKLVSRFLGELVALAAGGIPFDLFVEAGGIEFFEPTAEFRELVGAELQNRSFEFLDFTHEEELARRHGRYKPGTSNRAGNPGDERGRGGRRVEASAPRHALVAGLSRRAGNR